MIQTKDDSDVEPQESFELSLVTANGDKISTALVQIHDDDGEDTLQFSLIVFVCYCYVCARVLYVFGSYPGYTDISQFLLNIGIGPKAMTGK